MKILHLSADAVGGAGRAALRLHHSLIKSGLDSSVWARKLNSNHLAVSGPMNWRQEILATLRENIDAFPGRFNVESSNIPRSVAWIGGINAARVNKSNVDIVNLHWVGSGMISINEIGKINKPIVWTMHDMWPFCGAEHLSLDVPEARWRNLYVKNKSYGMRGIFDVDRWTWQRKKKSWIKKMQMVAPSSWLANCARNSSLMSEWDICVIPNALNVGVYKPLPKEFSRNALGLPLNKKLILFGAIGGVNTPHKGWDLLYPALNLLKKYDDIEFVVLGQSQPDEKIMGRVKVHWMGRLNDDIALALLYSAVDVTVVPSRQEAFCQVASESLACGCPVVAFNSTGLKDVVDHKTTGYLAKPFESDDLANGIMWVLEGESRRLILGEECRKKAIEKWSENIVADKYKNIYKQLLLK
jgi:glycosyltransferase involved in cell wall biosynthesis